MGSSQAMEMNVPMGDGPAVELSVPMKSCPVVVTCFPMGDGLAVVTSVLIRSGPAAMTSVPFGSTVRSSDKRKVFLYFVEFGAFERNRRKDFFYRGKNGRGTEKRAE